MTYAGDHHLGLSDVPVSVNSERTEGRRRHGEGIYRRAGHGDASILPRQHEKILRIAQDDLFLQVRFLAYIEMTERSRSLVTDTLI